MADVHGGMHICRPAPIYYMASSEHGFWLMSDLHIGANGNDYKLINRELAEAKKNGDRILVNGDVFDLILPSDRKRFSLSALHKRIHRVDILNAALEWGEEIFAPYADLIDMIGLGNHESSIEKHGSSDLVAMLIDKLRVHQKNKDHVIHYGGYTGFIDYRFRGRNSERIGRSRRFVIYYHHGSGGDSPVTKGMIDFARKHWVRADVMWMGHKHNKIGSVIRTMRCPMEGEQPILEEQRQVFTGAYYHTYEGQSQESVRKNGRRSNYAADRGMAPQGKGGTRIIVRLVGQNVELETKIVM